MKKILQILFIYSFFSFPEVSFSKEKTSKVSITKKTTQKKSKKKNKIQKACKNKAKTKKSVVKSDYENQKLKNIQEQQTAISNTIEPRDSDQNQKNNCPCPDNSKEEKNKADLSFLKSNLQDVQYTYYIWKDLVEDPQPNFDILKQFIVMHPQWPSMSKLKAKFEKKLSYQMNDDEILKWFLDNPPITVEGVTIYAKKLLQSGQTDRAAYFVKKIWRESEESDAVLSQFQKDFYDILEPQDHQERIHLLLSKEKIDDAKKVLGWLNKKLDWYPKPQRDLALMRIKLLDNKEKKEKLEEELEITKRVFKNDPGLFYEEIKWRRRQKENDRVIELLNSDVVQGVEKSDPSLFWGERNIMARRMLEEGCFQQSLNILKGHQLKTGEHYVVAEWLAAFLEIMYLQKTEDGYDRLKKLYNQVRMPISLSRIAYWIGIACERMKATEEAVRWYKKAAKHVGTYYGQLAICWLEDHRHQIPKTPIFYEENFSLSIKERFEKREMVQAVRMVAALGETPDTVDLFFKTLAKDVVDGEEYRLMTQLAAEIAPPKTAVSLSRVALDNMIITNGTYPVLEKSFLEQTVDKFKTNDPIYPHIIHALIRRESAFDPQALSSAGAKGLMQVIDATASKTIQKLSFLCGQNCKDPRKFSEPLYNVAIGTSYIKEQLEKYNDSIVLALCAYNAGPEAVDNIFCTSIGNPLTTKTNMVQWIELIPYGETRNYVMRVLESFVMYVERARQQNPSLPKYRMIDLIQRGVKTN